MVHLGPLCRGESGSRGVVEFVCSRADFARTAGGCRRGSVIAHGVGRSWPQVCSEGEPAKWASWMDTMPVIRKRHPEIAERLVAEFERGPHTPFLRAAVDAHGNFGV